MTTERFLTESPIAEKARVDARIVVRRFNVPAGSVRNSIRNGSIAANTAPVCELVVGGVVLGSGEIRNEGDSTVFVMTEVAE